jgi:hypothetical protein
MFICNARYDGANEGRDMPNRNIPAISDYQDAQDVIDDIFLSDAEKLDLLTKWKSDLESRLEAESEGMSSSDPIGHRHEASIANMLQSVTNAMVELGHKSDPRTDDSK